MYFEKITKKAPDAWPQVIARAVIPHCGGLGANRACSETRKQYADLTINRGLMDNIIVTEERKQYADLIFRAVRGLTDNIIVTTLRKYDARLARRPWSNARDLCQQYVIIVFD